MTDWVALSASRHRGAAWLPQRGYRFASALPMIAIRVQELSQLLPHYLIAFRAARAGFQPVVLLGAGDDSNLYVNTDGRWLASYVPEALRGYPFALGGHKEQDKGGRAEKVLCLHREHLLVEEVERKGALPLFNEKGELAVEVQRILEFLTQREQRAAVTSAATNALQDAGLIRPRALTLSRGPDEPPRRLEGVYGIDEKRLNALDTATFTGLRSSGALALAYVQLLSFSRTEHLERRMAYLRRQQPLTTAGADSGELFRDDQTLNFDQYD